MNRKLPCSWRFSLHGGARRGSAPRAREFFWRCSPWKLWRSVSSSSRAIRVRSPGCHGFSPPGRGHDLEETCDQPEPLAHRREAGNHRALASGSVPPSPIPADTQSKQSLPRPDRGFASRCPRTNTRVEVRVATPILHIRRQLAWHRFAAHAAGHRPGGHCACGSAPVDRRAAAHDTWHRWPDPECCCSPGSGRPSPERSLP